MRGYCLHRNSGKVTEFKEGQGYFKELRKSPGRCKPGKRMDVFVYLLL